MCHLTHCSCFHSPNSFSVFSNQRGLVTCTPVPQLRLSVACRTESKLLRQAFKALFCLPYLLASHTPTFSSLYPVLQKLASFVPHHTFPHTPAWRDLLSSPGNTCSSSKSQLRLSPPPGNLPEHQAGQRHFLSSLQCRGETTASRVNLISSVLRGPRMA